MKLHKILVTSTVLSATILLGSQAVLASGGGMGPVSSDTASTQSSAKQSKNILDKNVAIAHRGASGYAPEHTFSLMIKLKMSLTLIT